MRFSNITLRHLRVFVAVADSGSFTVASQRLGMTQPGVSHAIRAIEQQLGAQLFERRREKTVLTAMGRAGLTEAQSALVHLERLESVAHAHLKMGSATLRLALFPSANNTAVLGKIKTFRKRFPDVHVDIRGGSDEEIISSTRNREVDLGMVTLPHEEFATFPAFEDELMAVLPEIKRWARTRTIDPSVLVAESFLMPAGGCEALIRSLFTTAGNLPRSSLKVHNKSLLLALVRKGAGVSIVPSATLDPPQHRGVRVVRLRPRTFRRVAYAAVSAKDLSRAAQAFLETAPQSSCLEAHSDH